MTCYFNCPRCGNHEKFARAGESGWMLALIVLGVLSSLWWGEGLLSRWQCLNCGLVFRQPRIPPTAVSMVCVFVACTTIVLTLVALFAMAYPAQAVNTVGREVAAWLHKALVDGGGAMAYALAAGVLSILLLCAVISWISNYRHRQEIRRQFQTWPEGDGTTRERAKA